MSQTCSLDACAWFQQHFSLTVEDHAQGLKFNLSVKDPAKLSALQNLAKSAKEFCQAFCGCGS